MRSSRSSTRSPGSSTPSDASKATPLQHSKRAARARPGICCSGRSTIRSLRLVERVFKEEAGLDLVRRYIILLCARQVLARVQGETPEEFRGKTRRGDPELKARLDRLGELREQFSFGDPTERGRFLEWFEAWFLKRATPVEGGAS